MAEVWIPPKLQQLTGGHQQVQVEGTTVRRLVNNPEQSLLFDCSYLFEGGELF